MSLAKQPISLVAATLLVLVLSPSTFAQAASPERLEEVTQHGMYVMPIDLKQTQHIFTKTRLGVYNRLSPEAHQYATNRIDPQQSRFRRPTLAWFAFLA